MAKIKRVIEKAAGAAAAPIWVGRLAKRIKAILAAEREENKRIAARAAQTVSGLRKAREKARAESRRGR